MSRKAVFHRYRFDQSIWGGTFTESTLDQIAAAFQEDRLWGIDGDRFGFVNCLFRDGIVVGYFAQEGAKEIVDYDEDVNRILDYRRAFAHILFALHVESGVVALQSTKLIGFERLRLEDMRQKFPVAVKNLLYGEDSDIILPLMPYRLDLTHEQLYFVFREFPTRELIVTGLKGESVPSYEEFKLFNPRVDEDRIFRQIFGEDIEAGLNELKLEASEMADLRQSALARLSARVGKVESVVVESPDDPEEKITITKSTSTRFVTEVATESETVRVSAVDIAAVAAPLVVDQIALDSRSGVERFLRQMVTFIKSSRDTQDG